MRRIETPEALAELYPDPPAVALRKVAPQLTPLYRRWIEASRFCVLSTVGREGVHGTPRGDDGPVVRVADAGTLMMPDWRGNNRLDALRDIVEDPRVALLFLVPGSTTSLRVNGRAFLTDDAALRESFAHDGRLPTLVMVIEISEAFSQCAKALIRSGLWTRDDSAELPTVGQMLEEVTKGRDGGADYDFGYVARARETLW
ncbi:pyridoxamine 5'-phosphate oxidase family protein [Pseudoponticoccus marisrubri]|uniref:Pyridoxamine 5'-phosphate oxidase n=1 Tax=Pseudoponticoccus marisrubri TaxID=1685382 RepID=A0A0W7WPY3_9RHOB|nr:pyridoxamine 5'-phosphate oxidase family protein [Pseudoponticoccus marisrubri]KUF12670.1 pyridoxamine 5'-phosphate oxidase [Pseudoponticoccus marisrubri]